MLLLLFLSHSIKMASQLGGNVCFHLRFVLVQDVDKIFAIYVKVSKEALVDKGGKVSQFQLAWRLFKERVFRLNKVIRVEITTHQAGRLGRREPRRRRRHLALAFKPCRPFLLN